MPPPLYLGEAPTEATPSTDFTFHDLNSTYPSPPRSGYNSPVPPPPHPPPPLGSGGNGFFGGAPPPYGAELPSPYDDHHHHHQQQEPHLPHFHSPQFVPECLPPLSALTKTEDEEDDFVCDTAASPSGIHRYKVRKERTNEGENPRSRRLE